MDSFEAKVNAVTCTLLQSSAVRKECLDHDYCEDDNCLLCILRKICPYDTTYYDVDKMKDVLGFLLNDADEKLETNADIVELFKAVSSPFQGFNQVVEEKVCCSTCGFSTESEPYILREIELCITDGDIEGSVNNFFQSRPSESCDACDASTIRSTVICQPPDVLAVYPSSNKQQNLFTETLISQLNVVQVNNESYRLTGAVVNVGDMSSSNEFCSVSLDSGLLKLFVWNNVCNVQVRSVCVLLFDRVTINDSTRVLPMLSLDKIRISLISRCQEQQKGSVERLSLKTNDQPDRMSIPTLILNVHKAQLDSNLDKGEKLKNKEIQAESSQINNNNQFSNSKLSLFDRDSFGKFNCPQCCHKFSLKHRFKVHLANHRKTEYVETVRKKKNKSQGKRVPCTVCKKTFRKNHICKVDLQGQGGRVRHKYCKVKLNSKVLQSKSNPEDDKSKIFSCSICEMRFATQNYLNTHVIRLHKARNRKKGTGNRTFQCKLCSTSFSFKHSLQRHLQNMHSNDYLSQHREFKCTMCDKSFETSISLKRHIFMSHRSQENNIVTRTFKCKLCQKSFDVKENLRKHVRNIHSKYYLSQTWNFKCTMCDKSFETSRSLKKHTSTSHQTQENNAIKQTFQCDFCSRSFKQKSSLKRHVQTLHSKDFVSQILEYECKICKNKFDTNISLRKHISLSHRSKDNEVDEKKFKCNLCPTSFSHRNNLKRHIRNIHTEFYLSQPSEFQCSKCYHHFDSNLSLIRHVSLIHRTQENNSVEKSFQCNFCPSSFKQKGNLKRHVQALHS